MYTDANVNVFFSGVSIGNIVAFPLSIECCVIPLDGLGYSVALLHVCVEHCWFTAA